MKIHAAIYAESIWMHGDEILIGKLSIGFVDTSQVARVISLGFHHDVMM